MSWSGPSLGHPPSLHHHSSQTSQGSPPHPLIHHTYQPPQTFHYRQPQHHCHQQHFQHVSQMQHYDELRLAPLQSPELAKVDPRGRLEQQVLAFRPPQASRRRIDVSDLLSTPVTKTEDVPRASAQLDVHQSPTAVSRADIGDWPPHLRHVPAFTSINRLQHLDEHGVTLTIQHQPGGTLDPTQWTMPPPEQRPCSRQSSNGEGPSRLRSNRSVSSIHSASSSQDHSLDALSPFISPVSPASTLQQQTSLSASECDYELVFRQQPIAARACGLGDRDRRTIDPPPILELKITDKTTGYPVQDHANLYVLHCALCDVNGGPVRFPHSTSDDSRPVTAMMGNFVASPFGGKDERGIAGTFFVLHDLSCRYPGRYRLQLSLLRLDLVTYRSLQTAISVLSEPFTAYAAKDFPGMRESTPLLKQLRRQGLSVGIKKGSEARKLKSGMRRTNGMDELDHDVQAESQASRSRVRDDSPISNHGRDDTWMLHGSKRRRIA